MSSEEHPDEIFKVIIIGDSGVGKSCFLYNFTEGGFKEDHTVTIGVEYTTKIIHLREGVVKLQIWDTAGQETFRAITRSFYRNADGVILMFDLTSEESFSSLENWYEEAKSYGQPDSTMSLVGNMMDLESEREVPQSDAEKFIADKDIAHYHEASAKKGINVEE